jgi:leucyl aminopeptidase (aminopeptidase T)
MTTLEEISNIVWKQCINAKPDEKALIVSDPAEETTAQANRGKLSSHSGERLEIAEALTSTCPCKCRLMEMRPTGMHGREPSEDVAKAMLDADIVIAPLRYSITWTKATEAATARNAKVVTMPGITKDMFLRAIPINYRELTETNDKLKAILEGACKVRVTTKAGTDIMIEIQEGRKICNGNGTMKRGKVKNLPSGEVDFAPKEGASNGVIVFDLTILDSKVDRPYKVEVKNGLAVSCEHEKLWEALKGVEHGTNLAELGIGTNPKAKVIGQILEDEKVKGTAHIAFGSNAAAEGNIQTSVHLDSIFDRPTIEVDGKVIIKEGKFLF